MSTQAVENTNGLLLAKHLWNHNPLFARKDGLSFPLIL